MSHRLRCTYMERARSQAAREVGCPLDHCYCGTHDTENKEHQCLPQGDDTYGADGEVVGELHRAEINAGWDPDP